MIELVVGFAIAAVLLIAEYLLCTKLKSPLWGGIIPVCHSKHFVFWRLGNRPRQIQEN